MASLASRSRTSSDSANICSHSFSASSSSSIHFASAFCSTTGSLDASLKAFSSNRIIIHLFSFFHIYYHVFSTAVKQPKKLFRQALTFELRPRPARAVGLERIVRLPTLLH